MNLDTLPMAALWCFALLYVSITINLKDSQTAFTITGDFDHYNFGSKMHSHLH